MPNVSMLIRGLVVTLALAICPAMLVAEELGNQIVVRRIAGSADLGTAQHPDRQLAVVEAGSTENPAPPDPAPPDIVAPVQSPLPIWRPGDAPALKLRYARHYWLAYDRPQVHPSTAISKRSRSVDRISRTDHHEPAGAAASAEAARALYSESPNSGPSEPAYDDGQAHDDDGSSPLLRCSSASTPASNHGADSKPDASERIEFPGKSASQTALVGETSRLPTSTAWVQTLTRPVRALYSHFLSGRK